MKFFFNNFLKFFFKFFLNNFILLTKKIKYIKKKKKKKKKMQSLFNNSLKSYSKSLLTNVAKTTGSSLFASQSITQLKRLSTLNKKTNTLSLKRDYESKANYGKPDSSEKVYVIFYYWL